MIVLSHYGPHPHRLETRSSDLNPRNAHTRIEITEGLYKDTQQTTLTVTKLKQSWLDQLCDLGVATRTLHGAELQLTDELTLRLYPQAEQEASDVVRSRASA
jgi:hypothetical protein